MPCETSSYKIETTGYDTDSVITIPMHKAWKRSALPDLAAPPNVTTYSLMITFPRTDIDFSEEVQLNQISDFISFSWWKSRIIYRIFISFGVATISGMVQQKANEMFIVLIKAIRNIITISLK